MALIDVTELMTDPDFVDKLQLVTRFTQVSSSGENLLSEIAVDTVGSVQAASGDDVNKLPEAMRTKRISTFWLKGTIISSAPGKYSSILIFKGLRYQVMHVDDWSNFGQGYTAGVCVAEVPA